MASHIACIINILQSALGSDIQGISPAPVPDNVQFPYITVSEIVSEDQESLDGDDGLEYSMVQVSVWSPDYEEADAIRALAKKALSGFSGTVLGVSITGSNHDSNSEIYDPARELRQCVVRITLWFADSEAPSLKAYYSDRFNRADSALLGANWLQYVANSMYVAIASNVLHIPYNLVSQVPGRAIAVYNSTLSADQFSEIIVAAASLFSSTNTNSFGPMVRMSVDGLRGYELAIYSSGIHGNQRVNLSLLRMDNSLNPVDIVDLWDNPGTVAVSDGDVFRLEVRDTALTVKHNGTVLATITDSIYPTGFVGMGDMAIGADTREYQFSGWNGGEL